jgi:RNA polymerase-binding transcription factor
MNRNTPRFDKLFLESKRRQLMELRGQLQKTAATDEAEEAAIKNESGSQAREYEDDAQKLAMLETDGNLVNRDIDRLARVERALQKIDEGTYGFSDVSGQPIPDGRLEAMPDAINTVQEQAASERTG